jgi:transcriptional regulator
MYIPQAFRVTDLQTLHEFIERHSFATLVSSVEGKPFATHLPLLFDRTRSVHGALLGHVARANPQWHAFDGQQEALAMFQGPHAYVSPSWYATSPAVPTWNYTAVHVYGAPQVIDDDQAFSDLLDKLIAFYEAGMANPWSGRLPPDFRTNLMKGIVGFMMHIERIEGKFKLSQNVARADQEGAIAGLLREGDALSLATAEAMRQACGIEAGKDDPR